MKPDQELALALREAVVTANNGCMQWSTLLALMQRAADALDSNTVEVHVVHLSAREPDLQWPRQLNVGDKLSTWFSDRPDGKSTVLAVYPYSGRYKEHFTHVLKLTAPRTWAGSLEMAYDAR